MHYLQETVLKCLILLQISNTAVTADTFEGHASPGNFILKEEYTSSLDWSGKIKIDSNIPVTVQQYNDDTYFFLEGQQPLQSYEAMVLVTSDCSATTYIPTVTLGSDSIEVYVQGVLDPGSMPFLESSSYEAKWSYEDYWCQSEPPNTSSIASRIQRRVSSAFASFLPSSMATSNFLRDVTLTSEEREDVDKSEVDTLSSLTNVCNVNVEVMLDGCNHNVVVNAPKARAISATLENEEFSSSSQDPCVTNNEIDIFFDGPVTKRRKGKARVRVPSMEDQDVCIRAVPGRPFVDSSGRKLQALPLVAALPNFAVAESNELTKPSHSPTNNGTLDGVISSNQLKLGEEWTKNALGEHASVASFSVFSIALMTNGAPSDLVRDALVAALDEVRHAETSFDIASRLTGREINAGPLPESTHAFGQDINALAMAVAKEGCVDETLSALEAAAEVDLIDFVLASNYDRTHSKYSGIDTTVLTWIRDELRTISLEESAHSALAWRTFEWVCGVDSETCLRVKEHVLNEDNLERAFQRRFQAAFGDNGGSETLEAMRESWRKIYSQKDHHDAMVCDNYEVIGGDSISANDASLVSDMASKVIHDALCV